jgi:sugar (pentulose or hexulose) kinase
MNILSIDVGGTHVKVLVSDQDALTSIVHRGLNGQSPTRASRHARSTADGPSH